MSKHQRGFGKHGTALWHSMCGPVLDRKGNPILRPYGAAEGQIVYSVFMWVNVGLLG